MKNGLFFSTLVAQLFPEKKVLHSKFAFLRNNSLTIFLRNVRFLNCYLMPAVGGYLLSLARSVPVTERAWASKLLFGEKKINTPNYFSEFCYVSMLSSSQKDQYIYDIM